MSVFLKLTLDCSHWLTSHTMVYHSHAYITLRYGNTLSM